MTKTIVYIIKQLYLLPVILLITGMCSCKNTQVATAATELAEPLLVYRKSPCYGPCPAYEATIYSNGQVQLVPQKNMSLTDTLRFSLTDAELKTLTITIADLNYLSLQKLYRTQWTDMPATHLHFYKNGTEAKYIRHQEGGPEQLVKFIKDVHALLWKYVKQ